MLDPSCHLLPARPFLEASFFLSPLPFFVDEVIPEGIVAHPTGVHLILIFRTVSKAYLFSLIVSTSLHLMLVFLIIFLDFG